MTNRPTIQELQANGRVLKPKEFTGNIYGDYGYILNGVKSKNGYVSRVGARNALSRAIIKLYKKTK